MLLRASVRAAALGPDLPFTADPCCRSEAHRTGLSCLPQHFWWTKARSADFPDFRCICTDRRFGGCDVEQRKRKSLWVLLKLTG
jgi:hypothetical protein